MVTYTNPNQNKPVDIATDSSAVSNALPQQYSSDSAITASQLEAFLQKKDGLSTQFLMPVMKPFLVAGMSERQLEAIIAIPFGNAAKRGRNEKVYHFMEAVGHVYSTDYLESTTTNFNRFSLFLNTLGEAEDLRGGIASGGDPTTTYRLCINLIHELGLERAELLFDRLIDESKQRVGRVKKGISALYRIKELIDESKKTGYAPETLLDFRRDEIDRSYYSDDAED